MNVRPNGDWADKWKGEFVRLVVILIISLAISYLALSRKADELDRGFHTNCQHIESIRANQTTVLLAVLSLIDVLDDRTEAGLHRIPPSLRTRIIVALSNVPDARSCTGGN